MNAITILIALLLPFPTASWVAVLVPTNRHHKGSPGRHVDHQTHIYNNKCESPQTARYASKRSTTPNSSDDGNHNGLLSSRRDWLASAMTTTFRTSAVMGLIAVGKTTSAASAATATSIAQSTKPVSTIHTCDASVSVWQQPITGRKVYLLGTAHISIASAELAGDVIDDVRPDAVFVELDAKRVQQTVGSAPPTGSTAIATTTGTTLATTRSNSTPEQPTATPATALRTAPLAERGTGGFALPTKSASDVFSGPESPLPVASSSSSSSGMSNPAVAFGSAAVGSAIKGMYGKLGNAGFKPGEEFVIAVREGQKVGAKVILGDRDVEVTLRRLSEALRQTDLRALLSPDSELEASMKALLPKDLPTDSSDDNFKNEMSAYVETMKAKENVNVIMGQLKRVAPEIFQALVAERDAYMANGLDKLNAFPVIVAVMGIAHVDGVETYLKARGWTPVKLNCKALL